MATPFSHSSAREVVSRLRPGMTVFVPGVSGESLPFYEELLRDPERAAGVTFVGVHFPGINRTDYLALHPTTRQRAYFMSPAIRAALEDGRVDLMPLDYPGIVRDLEQNVSVDVAVAQVSPPDERGFCSLGASYDFLPSVWHQARVRVAHVNPRLPRTRGPMRFDRRLSSRVRVRSAPSPRSRSSRWMREHATRETRSNTGCGWGHAAVWSRPPADGYSRFARESSTSEPLFGNGVDRGHRTHRCRCNRR